MFLKNTYVRDKSKRLVAATVLLVSVYNILINICFSRPKRKNNEAKSQTKQTHFGTFLWQKKEKESKKQAILKFSNIHKEISSIFIFKK